MRLLHDPAPALAAAVAEEAVRVLPHLAQPRHRLLLITGGKGAGKTLCLHQIATQTDGAVVNLGLELSRRLLDLTTRERPLRVASLFRETVTGEERTGGPPILLDNIEVLFARELKQNALNLIRSLARDRVVVVAWPGAVEDGRLRYAAPGHPEHRTWPARDLAIRSLDPRSTSDAP